MYKMWYCDNNKDWLIELFLLYRRNHWMELPPYPTMWRTHHLWKHLNTSSKPIFSSNRITTITGKSLNSYTAPFPWLCCGAIEIVLLLLLFFIIIFIIIILQQTIILTTVHLKQPSVYPLCVMTTEHTYTLQHICNTIHTRIHHT